METELWVNTIVLVARWCWKGHFLVIMGKTQLFWSGLREAGLQAILSGDRVLSHSSRRWSFKLFSKEMQLQVNTIVLVARWSWKGHFSVAMGKTWLIYTGLRETELWVNTIVLVARWCWKGHFMVTVGKMWLFWSGVKETELWAVLHGDVALSQYCSFSGKMVLKRPFLSDTQEELAHLLKN